MAANAIERFKINLPGRGLAQKLFKGKRGDSYADGYDDYDDMNPDDSVDQDAYSASQEDDYDADDRYDDRQYDDDDYDDGYDDGGRYDDGYDDDRYDEGGYDDEDGYDDGRYDDGYDDGGRYDDGDRYDDDYDGDDFDDRYGSADADDEGDYYDEQSALMRYVDENDWVTYALLFLFPPLGIYLLWRRNCFERPVRIAVTAASAIWFVVALFLLLRGLFGAAGDRQVQPSITIPPQSVEQSAAPGATEAIASIDLGGGTQGGDSGQSLDSFSGSEGADAGGGGTSEDSELSVQPTATALAGSSGSAANASYVWSPATGLYYHSSDTCPRIEEGVQVWQVTREIAENSRHQSPCPDCIGGGTTQTYYGTIGGKYYHLDQTCSKMKDPLVYTKQAAENEGKAPCPVCILKTKDTLEESEDVGVVFVNDNSGDKSNIEVYATKNGSYFHVKKDCSNMEGAVKGTLRDALLAGKKACPKCCASAGTLVYCTSGGKSYHLDKYCQGMTGAKQITLAEAMVLGKTKCEICVGGTDAASASSSSSSSKSSEKGKTVTLGNATGSAVKVYATKNGKYYHTNSTCSGMQDAQLYTLKSMLQAGKKACPKCASSANTKVYATKGSKYYHSYATCSDMKNASSGTLAEALAAGLKRCPKCWGSSKASASGSSSSSSSAAKTTSSGSGKTATSGSGKTAASGSAKTASGGSANASAATSSSSASSSAARTATEKKAAKAASKATASNTYVYATREGSYYHLTSSCGGMTGASRITLKTAVKAGKKPCPICASAAKRTVYSTSNGDHYHAASVCVQSGMKNGAKRTLAEALLKGQTACPYCLGSKKAAQTATAVAKAVNSSDSKAAEKLKAAAQKAAAQKAAEQKTTAERKSSGTYRSGKSGVRVYATVSDKYYHTRSSCSSLSGSPSRVTLETALNYGKKPCPNCASTASRTVYATKGGKYYHYSKSDAGSGAKQGTLASALAYGFDPCPNCVTHTASSGESTGKYQSGTSGIKVYATAGSKYYHSRANCSGLTGATRVSLETALNYGKKACPVCLAAAGVKVYAKAGDKYYHYFKAHAGSGAIAGSLAAARALGLTACPTCSKLSAGSNSPDNGGTEYAPVSIEYYPASGDTGVYVDIATVNSYYHKHSKCSNAKFSGGTKVTLQYAIDWDYKACPYCNPPTSVIGSSDT